MAYNLESLIKISDQILHPERHHPWILDPSKKPEIESMLEKACFLQDLFESPSPVTNEKVQSLEGRIRDTAHDAEDVIESHLTDQLLLSRKGERIIISPPDMQKVIGEFDLVKEEMMKIIDGTHGTASSSIPISSTEELNPTNMVVGISDDLLQLKDRLIEHHSKLEIIPVVGMGGIGKTTLVRTLYDDPLIVSHFDTCAWVVISQSYNVQEILVGLLSCILREDKMISWSKEELALHLYQILYGRRYLIVLDDMWSYEAWDDIKISFPDENNGSRIMVTTKELSVASYLDSQSSYYQMNFLNEVESWNLLHQKLFGEETCPSKLKQIGHNIARDCGGLPLAIHVVGGLLSQLGKTEESWIQVANDVSSAIINNNEKFSNILYLSYSHLPNHLKPCFLYMATFPEDCEIPVAKLMRLWVAEGFLKPILGKNLEDVAKLYLKALVDRNLLLVCQQEFKGNVKSYVMHDLLRDLCIRKAHEEKFLNIMIGGFNQKDMQYMRRLSATTSNHFEFISNSPDLAKVTRSIVLPTSSRIHGQDDDISLWINISELRLLRILDIWAIDVHNFSEQLGKLVHLRYLSFVWPHPISPGSLSTLHNLQTLVIYWRPQELKCYVLFDMPRLKHIKFKGNCPRCDLPDGEGIVVQENLETLSSVIIDNSFPKILKITPNLKKLGIIKDKDISISSTIDMTCLIKLETLKCEGLGDLLESATSFLSFLIFPHSLKKLTLKNCRLSSRCMERIGALPNLQILKLQRCAFESMTWEPTEGEFCQLRLLILEPLGLMTWVANETHYPRLERLIIRDCIHLKEIPCGIGDILTLEIIEVHGHNSYSVLESSRKIQNEQIELGNDTLQVRINAETDQFSRSWMNGYLTGEIFAHLT